MNKMILSLSVVSLILLGADCNANTNQPPAAIINTAVVSENQVSISNFAFEPKILTVKTGQTVTWIQNDGVDHTIVSGNLFESLVLRRGDKFSFTFNTPGEFNFHCGIHPSMTGKIIVE